MESESKSQPPSLISSAEPTSLSQVMHVEDDNVSIESSSYMPRARDTVATQSRSTTFTELPRPSDLGRV